jgi:16S rRNA (adenine1518-N6/adenine1519-N6)-dimethyltransferase
MIVPFSHRFVRESLASLGMRPQKKWGQNFLLDPQIHERLVAHADLHPEEVVLEIGPGLGHLTQFLLEKVQTVWAVEIDSRLAQHLSHTFSDHPGFHLLNVDVLSSKNALNPVVLEQIQHVANAVPWKLVANLPYSVATPVVMNMLQLNPPPTLMVVTIQQEVAERLMARPGSKEYGAVSVCARLYASITDIQSISPRSFYPPPKVYSTVVKITPHAKRQDVDLEFFEQVVQSAFQSRRKTIGNALRHAWAGTIESPKLLQILEDCQISPDCRGEVLSVDAFISLTQHMRKLLP